MRNFCLIIIIVYSTITSHEAKTNSVIDCKNLQCGKLENPVCVKVICINDLKAKDVLIVAFNECEVLRAKCLPGVKVNVMPMKTCDHGMKIYTNITHNQRAKRDISDDKNVKPADGEVSNIGDEGIEVVQHDSDNYGHQISVDDDNIEGLNADDVGEPNLDKIDEESQRDDNIDGRDIAYPERSNFNVTAESSDAEHGINNVAADYEISDEEKVNVTEYKADCPRECPVREMMICARCQHNIYRTFLSVCHLRLFHCRHPTEKLELVSRLPCMQSAPFLTGLPRAIAKISEPGDEDRVLKYIQCREKHRLGRDDPSCQFRRHLK